MNVISKDELIRGLLDTSALEGGLDVSGVVADSVPEVKGSLVHTIKGIIPVYKEWGKTPLEMLNLLKEKYPRIADLPLSYAGRLDPLAEGLMLVLVGDTNQDREKYLHLDKTYEVEILFGVKTDTGDLFGIPEVEGHVSSSFESSSNDLEEILKSFVGKQQFPYPVYSSKTVQGKPLFQWMNEGKISEIEIPKTDVEIYSIKTLGKLQNINGTAILEKIENSLKIVKGDFRYKEIEEGWNTLLSEKVCQNFYTLKIECSCSSGTYMRVLAEEIGKKVDMPSLAYSIRRTLVGEVDIVKAIHIV
ncbi:MAG: hypothetical protein K9M11_00115 [Candidatus Pacebacteria bacterium]|nr:hypothetical protein [Candidatus Paceibacterota bacterium]